MRETDGVARLETSLTRMSIPRLRAAPIWSRVTQQQSVPRWRERTPASECRGVGRVSFKSFGIHLGAVLSDIYHEVRQVSMRRSLTVLCEIVRLTETNY